MHRTIIFLSASLLLNAGGVFCQQKTDTVFDAAKLVKPGASLIQVSKQFSFTEGAAVDKKGNIFFTDQPNDKIWKYDINGKLTLFMDKTGRSNGLYFDKKGNLLACADEHNELWSISPGKKIEVLITAFQGQQLNGPNDLWIDQKGGIFFTDPYYQRDYWKRQKPEIEAQRVYYLPEGKSEPVAVAADILQPNGIVGTPDGKYLFVADIGDNKTYRYNIGDDGTLSARKLFVPQGADGITLDSAGNLYLCGKGVTVYDSSGIKIAYIPVPSDWTGNLCFGGKDRKTLFITATESIYMLEMAVKGCE